MKLTDSIFIKCSFCGKKLIKRMPSGVFKFEFGNRVGDSPPIDMLIQGNIKMRCIRKTCKEWNEIHMFPSEFKIIN